MTSSFGFSIRQTFLFNAIWFFSMNRCGWWWYSSIHFSVCLLVTLLVKKKEKQKLRVKIMNKEILISTIQLIMSSKTIKYTIIHWTRQPFFLASSEIIHVHVSILVWKESFILMAAYIKRFKNETVNKNRDENHFSNWLKSYYQRDQINRLVSDSFFFFRMKSIEQLAVSFTNSFH